MYDLLCTVPRHYQTIKKTSTRIFNTNKHNQRYQYDNIDTNTIYIEYEYTKINKHHWFYKIKSLDTWKINNGFLCLLQGWTTISLSSSSSSTLSTLSELSGEAREGQQTLDQQSSIKSLDIFFEMFLDLFWGAYGKYWIPLFLRAISWDSLENWPSANGGTEQRIWTASRGPLWPC